MAREMIHSGIEWIGEIPKEWRIGKVKNYYSLQTGFTPDTKNELYYDDNGLPWVNISDIGDSHYINTTKKRISQYYISKYNPTIVPKGSLLYSFKLSVGTVAIAGIDLYTNEAIASFLQGENVNLNYLFYSSQVCIIHNANENIYGAKLLNQDLINNATILFPSLPEQQKIANYLDKVCGEVDEMIALQEQMIEELKAYKQSVITEAVTKGLNPGVSMKDSGIDWIGEVPDHWEVKKIGYVFYNLDYLREPISAELRERNNPQYDYYGASGVIDKIDHYNVEDKVLLIGEDGANLVMRNLPLIYKAEGKFWVNNHAHILKPIKDDYNYMAHTLEAADYRNYITGFAQPKLSQENLKAVKLPVPPLSEQQSIASYLDTKCAEIDALIAIKQAKIEELKEYKKSVIYEYVTGKKEVV